MKKIIILFSLLMAVLPTIINAQTKEDKWVSLGTYLNHLKMDQSRSWSNATSKYTFTTNFLPSSDALADQVIIKKLAYKKHPLHGEQNQGANLILQEVEGMNGKNPVYGKTATISKTFDIKDLNGKKIKSKEIPSNEDGWKIYEFDNLMRIASIGSFSNVYNLGGTDPRYMDIGVEEIPIFNDIYVAIADIKPLTSAYGNAIMTEAYNNLFTTPEKEGWIVSKSNNLEDGTIVDHYKEGVRTYKKKNGDFATFIEIDDIRDPETLDLISGSNLSPDSSVYPIGAFRITQPNGLIIESDGIFPTIIFKDGSNLQMNIDFRDKYFNVYKDQVKNVLNYSTAAEERGDYGLVSVLKKNSSKNIEKFLTNNKKNAFFPFSNITFQDFISPNDEVVLGKSGFNDIIYNSSNDIRTTRRPTWEYPFEYVNGDDKLGNLRFFDYYDSQKIFNPSNFSVLDLNEDGLQFYGLDLALNVNDLPRLNKIFEYDDVIFQNPNKIANYYVSESNGSPKAQFLSKVEYENGDILNLSYKPSYRELVDEDGTLLTLPNGTKVENIEGKWKVTHPDGSRFIGDLKRDNLENAPTSVLFYNDYVNSGKFNRYYNGTLTLPDGTQYHYVNGVNQEEATKAYEERKKKEAEEIQAMYNKLIQKYGKSNVDNALSFKITNGMSIKMLIEIGLPLIFDNDNSYYDWYKLITGAGERKRIDGTISVVSTYRLLKVDKNTDKVVYVGTEQLGY